MYVNNFLDVNNDKKGVNSHTQDLRSESHLLKLISLTNLLSFISSPFLYFNINRIVRQECHRQINVGLRK